MNKVLLIIILYVFPVYSLASNIPPSVNMVKAHRFEDNVIRIIQHNMEINPEIEVEVFSTPDYKLIDDIVISQVKVNGQVLGFDNVSGVFVESIGLIDGNVEFVLDYYFRRGGSEIIVCKLSVSNDELVAPSCRFSN